MTRWIVGLGNPGVRFEATRHNAGFWFADRLAEALGVSFRKPWFRPFLCAQYREGERTLVILKPMVFMNRSCLALRRLYRQGELVPENLLVVFDQMDLPPGRTKLKLRGSSAGHNGLKSLDSLFEPQSYARLSIGIGRNRDDFVAHVLGTPPQEERKAIDRAVFLAASQVAARWASGWEGLIHGINCIDEKTPVPLEGSASTL
jgi:PTH1 family peptidyl-tRNA hydrolase